MCFVVTLEIKITVLHLLIPLIAYSLKLKLCMPYNLFYVIQHLMIKFEKKKQEVEINSKIETINRIIVHSPLSFTSSFSRMMMDFIRKFLFMIHVLPLEIPRFTSDKNDPSPSPPVRILIFQSIYLTSGSITY